jgi:hypothetical protein
MRRETLRVGIALATSGGNSVAFVGFNLERTRKFREQLQQIAPFAEAKKPFEKRDEAVS